MPILRLANRKVCPISVNQEGHVCIPMKRMINRPPFDNAEKRDVLFKQIESIPGLKITDVGMKGFPHFPISSLVDENRLQSFIETLDWITSEIRTNG